MLAVWVDIYQMLACVFMIERISPLVERALFQFYS